MKILELLREIERIAIPFLAGVLVLWALCNNNRIETKIDALSGHVTKIDAILKTLSDEVERLTRERINDAR